MTHGITQVYVILYDKTERQIKWWNEQLLHYNENIEYFISIVLHKNDYMSIFLSP